MIKETVCGSCSYRFRFNTDKDSTRCPICGELYEIDHITTIGEMFREGEEE